MVEKYSDLEERIKRDRDLSLTGLDRVTYTLRWLDRNPNHLPGRTITEGEFDELVDALHQNWATPEYFSGVLSDALIDHGVTVIPDPEPTNAEKLVGDLLDCHVAFSERELDAIAGHLAKRGWTKAPGGDDD